MANFPDSPGIGSVFIDSTSGFSYKWTGAVWKSFNEAAASEQKVMDDISSSFDNSTTVFDLTVGSSAFEPPNAQSIQVSVGGVIQEPNVDYTIDGSNITFTTAPNAGLDFFAVSRATTVSLDFALDGNVQTKQQYTATEGQTTFSVTGGYVVDHLDVYRNGVRLRSTNDFTATNGSTFVLVAPASAGDLLETVSFKVASLVTTTGNFSNLNVTGIVTAASFVGSGEGLTGVASTDNIQTATSAKFLNNVNVSGITTLATLAVSGITTLTGTATVGVVTGGTSISAGVYYGDGSALTGIDASSLKSGSDVKAQANPGGVVITGVATATTFKGNLTGDVVGDVTGDVTGNADTATLATNASGLTGTPNITVGSVNASSAVISGNLSVGGTITYQDATNMDVLGVGTFQQGIQILANGANVTGIVTVGLTTIKSGEIDVLGVVTSTTFKAGTAISITDGAVSATRFHASNINVDNLIATENRFITGAEKSTRVTSGNVANLNYNSSSSNTAIVMAPDGNLTLNVRGIPESSDFDDHMISFAVISRSAGTAYSCLTVTLNDLSRPIHFVGGDSPTATAGVITTRGYSAYTFTGINTVGSASTTANYVVLGSVSGGYF